MTKSATIEADSQTPSLEEEAAAMDAQASEQAEPLLNGEEATPERPEWLPEKFTTVEEMAAAYAALEQKQGAAEGDTEETTKTETEATEEAAEEAVTQAGLDMTALSTEYAENGELSAESLSKLEAVGISKDIVDQYIAGQEAAAAALQTELLGSVGGPEVYSEMTVWAGENLSDAEIETFNSILEGGDKGAVKMAVENLHAKYTAVNGAEPSRQLAGKSVDSSLPRYESTIDLLADMGSPEYSKNEAFRKKVEAKLARSNIM